ncbi:MAG: hypothetical protein M0R17_07410 [Candidatus Omnitrophica bacterium]|jgi:hypothetical protein|nr:hypothetical protein [Candidatus Omnitrophota bacterium]
MKTVTFWKSDFTEENLDQLIDILKQYSAKGCGCWFILHTNFIEATFPELSDYVWIMENVSDFSNLKINHGWIMKNVVDNLNDSRFKQII